MELYRVKSLTFTYPGQFAPALRDVSLTLCAGEFVTLCGLSGSGKSTLLRQLKTALAPNGVRSGAVLFAGRLLSDVSPREQAERIGFVQQSPENQIVTDKVWHELAFGLENLGLPTEVIRRRVGEMASYFGIQDLFRCDTDSLSGGQKQLLNLASVMVMQPKLLILDEPTSQLDPIAAADFIATLRKLNNELGLTVLLVEHRLEEVFPIADKVLLMDKGRVLLYDTPRDVGRSLAASHPMQLGLPSAVRIFNALGQDGACPLTVREGRDFLERLLAPEPPAAGDDAPPPYVHDGEAALEMKNVFFRYERSLPDVLRGASLCVYKGEFYCLLGGNGTGKTTTLNVLAGLNRAYRGKVRVGGRPIGDYKGGTLYRGNLALLPQNPQTVFVRDRLRDDFAELLEAQGVKKEERDARIASVAEKIGVAALLDQHPYDLSGGEQQKCAIAKMLLLEPRILLMDEPTKGLDAHAKRVLRDILRALKADGITILMVTHDVAFAAENADRCALFFDGEVLSADVPERFFAENNFYTTAANRMARRFWKYAVTCEQVTARAREALRASEAAGARGEQA